MDARRYKITEGDKDSGSFYIEVDYSEPIKEAVTGFEESRKDENTSISYSGFLLGVYEKKQEISFAKWREIYAHFSSAEVEPTMFDRPITLSRIGLDRFESELSEDEKKWCILTLTDAIQVITKDKYFRDFSSKGGGINLMETEIAMTSLHLLFPLLDKNECIELEMMTSYLLISHFHDNEKKEFFEYEWIF